MADRAFELPNLQEIRIAECSEGSMSLLDAVIAPNLQEFHLRMFGINDIHSLSPITRFLARTTPGSLSSLYLRYSSEEDSLDVHKFELAVLRLVPSLTILSLDLTIIRPEVIKALKISSSTEFSLPLPGVPPSPRRGRTVAP